MPYATKRHAGRVLTQDRDVDDSAAIIGDNLLPSNNYAKRIQETLKMSKQSATRKNYRNRIQRIIKFWGINCPEYYAQGVVTVSEADLNDPAKYFFDGKFKTDIIYEGLNVDFF